MFWLSLRGIWIWMFTGMHSPAAPPAGRTAPPPAPPPRSSCPSWAGWSPAGRRSRGPGLNILLLPNTVCDYLLSVSILFVCHVLVHWSHSWTLGEIKKYIADTTCEKANSFGTNCFGAISADHWKILLVKGLLIPFKGVIEGAFHMSVRVWL